MTLLLRFNLNSPTKTNGKRQIKLFIGKHTAITQECNDLMLLRVSLTAPKNSLSRGAFLGEKENSKNLPLTLTPTTFRATFSESEIISDII
jgi:hypothetical protein